MTERDLILSLRKKDFVVTTFRGSGPGGQHRNTRDTAVRIVHPASGALAESQEHKSQDQNRKAAWARLRDTDVFQTWLRKAIAEASLTSEQKRAMEQRAIQWVERYMDPGNIIVEYQDDAGRWVPMPSPAECDVCSDTGMAYDTTEDRMVPCGRIDCTVSASTGQSLDPS